MRSPIFLGIGKAAHKYYMLFQHHTAPNEVDSNPDSSFVVGSRPGPYITEKSVSICANLGPRTVFYGLECRMERTRHRICYESTYDAMFERLENAVVPGKTKHLLVLLGVPLAYPRLVWLESLLGSHFITAPIKLMNKVFGFAGGMFNNFDGSSELLDDLDDHCKRTIFAENRNPNLILVSRVLCTSQKGAKPIRMASPRIRPEETCPHHSSKRRRPPRRCRPIFLPSPSQNPSK